MKLQLTSLTWAAMAAAFLLQVASAANDPNALVISHKPVSWAVKGQPLTLKAAVSGGVGGIDSVTLYYALFRDAAPFRVNMASTGAGLYVGTIEAGLLTGVSSVSYYIEAQDKEGTLEETPWYDVTFKDPEPGRAGSGGAMVAPTGAAAGKAAPSKDEGSSAVTVGLIAGGAAAIAVGAYLISDSGGSSDDDDTGGGGDDPGDKAGTYSGSATICLTIPPASTTCSNQAMSILIDRNGSVFSDALVPGQQLVGSLQGNSFSLNADMSNPEAGFTGNIIFSGTVVGDSSIVGSVNGSADDNGAAGFYSGEFNASK